MNHFRKLLEASNAHPFFFIGSGFTRRYLQTDDWKGLISRFAAQAMPGNEFAFEIYRNEADPSALPENQLLPAITQRVEKDYNKRFFVSDDFVDLRARYAKEVHGGVSPLKIGIADWFRSQETRFMNPSHPDEISALGHCRKNVAGIITTNFDRYLEHLFPDYSPYVGQDQLLFNPSYGVGEIYKIHGCISDPHSLVLTKSDYDRYQGRNAYLSAKLLTIFLEHPIIFLGYSLSDSNIRLIFQDIARCLNEAQLQTLSNRLFFIQRCQGGQPDSTNMVRETFDGKVIEFQRLLLNDFSQIYKAVASLRSTYPQRILRKLKQDVYELVATTTPKDRICVVDIDNATDLDKVEFVMGVGTIKRLGGIGYSGLGIKDLVEDLVLEDKGYDAASVIELVLPKLGRQCSYNLPIFKYVTRLKDTPMDEDLQKKVAEIKRNGIQTWITESMKKAQGGKPCPKSLSELRSNVDCSEIKGTYQALDRLPFMAPQNIKTEELKAWLAELYKHFDPIENKIPSLSTSFRRAVKIYDWLAYGYTKKPVMPKGN